MSQQFSDRYPPSLLGLGAAWQRWMRVCLCLCVCNSACLLACLHLFLPSFSSCGCVIERDWGNQISNSQDCEDRTSGRCDPTGGVIVVPADTRRSCGTCAAGCSGCWVNVNDRRGVARRLHAVLWSCHYRHHRALDAGYLVYPVYSRLHNPNSSSQAEPYTTGVCLLHEVWPWWIIYIQEIFHTKYGFSGRYILIV